MTSFDPSWRISFTWFIVWKGLIQKVIVCWAWKFYEVVPIVNQKLFIIFFWIKTSCVVPVDSMPAYEYPKTYDYQNYRFHSLNGHPPTLVIYWNKELWILFLFESKSYCYSKIYDNRAIYQGLDNFIFHFSLFGYQQDKADDEASRKERWLEHYPFLEILKDSFLFPFYSHFLSTFPKNPKTDKPNNYDSNSDRCSIWRWSCKKNCNSYYYRYDARGISHDY